MTLTNLKKSLTSIGNQIGQIEKKNSVIRSYWKPVEPGLQLKIQLLDIKFADTRD